MPYGRYPERVKAFRKWSAERVDKANINDSATSKSTSKKRRIRRRKKRNAQVHET